MLSKQIGKKLCHENEKIKRMINNSNYTLVSKSINNNNNLL